jgi:hypothetical protein
MSRLDVGIVGASVVTTDKCPTWFFALVLIRSMQQVAMKKYRRTGFQLTMHKFQTLAGDFHTLKIRSGLVTDTLMLDSTH